MENHGTDPKRRFALMRERVEAMKAIWTQDEADYHGEHVDFDPIWSWPKPIQEPHPPVLVGGNGDAGARARGRLRRRVDAESGQRPAGADRGAPGSRRRPDAIHPGDSLGREAGSRADRARRGGRRSPLHLLHPARGRGRDRAPLDELAETLGLVRRAELSLGGAAHPGKLARVRRVGVRSKPRLTFRLRNRRSQVRILSGALHVEARQIGFRTREAATVPQLTDRSKGGGSLPSRACRDHRATIACTPTTEPKPRGAEVFN